MIIVNFFTKIYCWCAFCSPHYYIVIKNIFICSKRIFQAAESGNLDDFNRLFIAEPARLEVRDSKGRAAVHQAAARNKLNILQFIRNHGGGKFYI